jgi:hypothetical protein
MTNNKLALSDGPSQQNSRQPLHLRRWPALACEELVSAGVRDWRLSSQCSVLTQPEQRETLTLLNVIACHTERPWLARVCLLSISPERSRPRPAHEPWRQTIWSLGIKIATSKIGTRDLQRRKRETELCSGAGFGLSFPSFLPKRTHLHCSGLQSHDGVEYENLGAR